MEDRFSTDRPQIPLAYEQAVEVIEEHCLPVLIEIADTDTAGTVNTIRHGLGRIPRGVRIARCVVAAGAGPTVGLAYQEANDENWTATTLNVRFADDNMRVLLEVF